MDAKGVRNMYSILVVFNKHNTARVASCWFIIYYKQSSDYPPIQKKLKTKLYNCRAKYSSFKNA